MCANSAYIVADKFYNCNSFSKKIKFCYFLQLFATNLYPLHFSHNFFCFALLFSVFLVFPLKTVDQEV